MWASTKRTLSATACLCLTLSAFTVTAAAPAQAQSPQPAQPGQEHPPKRTIASEGVQLPDPATQADAAFQAAKAQLAAQGHAAPGRLTTCTSFTRVNTMTDPVVAKAAADQAIADAHAQAQNMTGVGRSFEGSVTDSSALSVSPQPVPISPIELPEIPITEEVTNPTTVTVVLDGGVHVEISGSGGPGETPRAVTYEVNLAKCSVALRYATPAEQEQLDAEYKQKAQEKAQEVSGSLLNRASVNPANSSDPSTNWPEPSGWAWRTLYLSSLDPGNILVAQTIQSLTWAWPNSSSLNYWSGWQNCWGAFPTYLGTYWYTSFCSNRSPQGYYGYSAAVGNEALYWNSNFAVCQATAGTAYAYHYVYLAGYPYGWHDWKANWYYYGAPCSWLLKGTAYLYGSS